MSVFSSLKSFKNSSIRRAIRLDDFLYPTFSQAASESSGLAWIFASGMPFASGMEIANL